MNGKRYFIRNVLLHRHDTFAFGFSHNPSMTTFSAIWSISHRIPFELVFPASIPPTLQLPILCCISSKENVQSKFSNLIEVKRWKWASLQSFSTFFHFPLKIVFQIMQMTRSKKSKAFTIKKRRRKENSQIGMTYTCCRAVIAHTIQSLKSIWY